MLLTLNMGKKARMNSAKLPLWTIYNKFVLYCDWTVDLQKPNGSRACLLLHFLHLFIKTGAWLPPCLFEAVPALLDAAVSVSI